MNSKEKYRHSEKGKKAIYRANKKYFQTEKGKEIKSIANKKYSQSEKGKEARKRSNLQPASIERRRAWEQSEEGKEKRRAIRARYNLKMKIKKIKSKLTFEQNYFLDLLTLLLFF